MRGTLGSLIQCPVGLQTLPALGMSMCHEPPLTVIFRPAMTRSIWLGSDEFRNVPTSLEDACERPRQTLLKNLVIEDH